MFSGSIGLAGWFGKLPSNSKKSGTISHGRWRKTWGTVRPAMPLPASIAILNGLIVAGSMNERQCVANSSRMSRRSIVPLRTAVVKMPAATRSRMAESPVSRESACALSLVILCDAVIITPPPKP